jgi:excisionase family DNA binding protein
MSEMITLDQAVRLLDTSRPTFYRWLNEGKLKGVKIGRKWQFRRTDVEALLQPTTSESRELVRELEQAIAWYTDRLKRRKP